MTTDPGWESFKSCLRIQKDLDLEAWDVMLFQPLKDLSAWWSRQSEATKLFSVWLAAKAEPALIRWVARVAKIADAELAVTFGEALLAVLAGLTLGSFMDVVGRCLAQQIPNA